jgi:hypothetical protein
MNRKIGVMQPYFFPYIGYFQLIAAVDQFVIYDNIKYTKKGWINRNRLLARGSETPFSIPLKSNSDSCNIVDKELAPNFESQKLLNRVFDYYHRAPFFSQCFPLIEEILQSEERNLFRFLKYSIGRTCNFLDINTKILTSSEINIDHDLRSQDRVIAICKALNGSVYINSAGGKALYTKDSFEEYDIELKFMQTGLFEYSQHTQNFVPFLSIIDVIMFNSVFKIRNDYLKNYSFV